MDLLPSGNVKVDSGIFEPGAQARGQTHEM